MILKIAAISPLFIPLVFGSVPQEHSHDLILNAARLIIQKSKNPIAKVDVVFGLLGKVAADGGISQAGLTGQIDDICLHQSLADECLTVAKALNMDKNSMASCIQYQGLERNTVKVGEASPICSQPVVNKEISSFAQHQDAAGGADAIQNNILVETEVAKQMVALGFSPAEAVNLAFQTATFAAGDINDTSGKGNTCDFVVPGVFDVFATVDGLKGSAGISGTVLGQTISPEQQIDCVTLAALTNDTQHNVVPAIKEADLLAALGAADQAAQSNPVVAAVAPSLTSGAAVSIVTEIVCP